MKIGARHQVIADLITENWENIGTVQSQDRDIPISNLDPISYPTYVVVRLVLFK